MNLQDTELNGVINVLKPPGMTSHNVVGFLRRSLKIKKAGHTGTLDPGVAGVLPVCIGKATKTIEYMSADVKQYRAEITFGRSTDTQDGFGRTVSQSDASGLRTEEVEAALLRLRGRVSQVPPMVSALKHKGRKLYELAREGITVEREPRSIEIFEVRIIRCSGFGTPQPSVLFDVTCSKGSYVRTICHDIGQQMGCGAYMSFLVRTGTGRFLIADSYTLEEIAELSEKGLIATVLLPVEDVLPMQPVWVCDDVVKSVGHGNRVYMSGVHSMPSELADGTFVKLVNRHAGCLAVARVILEGGEDGRTETGFSGVRGGYVFQPVKVFL